MMMKRICFLLICYAATTAIFGQELRCGSPRTNGIDIELSQVELHISVFDEECIAYRFELSENKKLSCVETQRTLRIRQLTPSKGTLSVFIPRQMVLDNCSLRVNRASIDIEGVTAVNLLTMVNMGSLSIKEGALKTSVINLAGSSLVLDQTEIVRSCALTVTDAKAVLNLPSKESEYHLDYVQNKGSLTISGTDYTTSPGEYGNPRAKRRLIISGGASALSIEFSKNDNKKEQNKT